MKCAACGAPRLRRTERAIVLTGPGKLRPGRVCRACASTGWLLVLGDADGGPERVRKRAAAARERSELVQSVVSEAMDRAGIAIAMRPLRCEHESRLGRCALDLGHAGRHRIEAKP